MSPQLRPVIFAACASLLFSGCSVTLNQKDLFTLRDRQIPVESLNLMREADRERIVAISLDVANRKFQGYQFKSTQPKRAVLFFAGSGYSAPAAMGRVIANYANSVDNATDVYFLSYGERDETPPAIAEVYQMAEKLALLAQSQSGIAANTITAMGHSFGTWPSMHLAANGKIGCAVLMGTPTDIIETSYSVLPKFAPALVQFKATDDVAMLNNITLASRVSIPTLVVGSQADRYTPEIFSQKIYASLAENSGREIFISKDVAHGSYLRNAEVTAVIAGFMQRKCGG